MADGDRRLDARNVTRGTALCASLEVAESFGGRLMGLMGRPSLAPDAGLWLRPASSIHMLFMRFPIDVTFLGRPAANGARAASWRCGPRCARGRASSGGPGARTAASSCRLEPSPRPGRSLGTQLCWARRTRFAADPEPATRAPADRSGTAGPGLEPLHRTHNRTPVRLPGVTDGPDGWVLASGGRRPAGLMRKAGPGAPRERLPCA